MTHSFRSPNRANTPFRLPHAGIYIRSRMMRLPVPRKTTAAASTQSCAEPGITPVPVHPRQLHLIFPGAGSRACDTILSPICRPISRLEAVDHVPRIGHSFGKGGTIGGSRGDNPRIISLRPSIWRRPRELRRRAGARPPRTHDETVTKNRDAYIMIVMRIDTAITRQFMRHAVC